MNDANDVAVAQAALWLIGAASGLGGPLPGCARGPEALRATGMAARLAAGNAAWAAELGTDHRIEKPLPESLAHFCRSLAEAVARPAAARERFAVVGGDHSCAVGTWSGAASALCPAGPVGLIWIDAHLDSHTPDTTPSGQYHGMPVACLLGHGDAALTGIAGGRPALSPEHVCIVGARSYEPAEPELLDRLGVRVFYQDEVIARGLDAVMEDAAAIVRRGTAGFGVSIDLDVLDPADAPAVGSPEPDGLFLAELFRALAPFAGAADLIGCEVVEFNPDLSGAAQTAQAAETLIAAMFGGAP